jgi:phosphoribosylformylglycinamidine synthase
MIYFFLNKYLTAFAVETSGHLSNEDMEKLYWLFGEASRHDVSVLPGRYTGPRKEMITPWSTNAVEITQNMGIRGIGRIEEFVEVKEQHSRFDPMLQAVYENPGQEVFRIERTPEPVKPVKDIAAYSLQEGLALSEEETKYLEGLSRKLKRNLTDSEIFGFSQVNSEHCRHKIFNGTFIIDGRTMEESLFSLIRKTSNLNPNRLVSAYKDNVAFIFGPVVEEFAPATQDKPDYFRIRDIETVLSLKAETHNFPTTVEPFNGAATGTGGEIRDRMAGGRGSLPLAGTAVYMTSYPRLLPGRGWEQKTRERHWLYQTPAEILIKASNGASDFGNKFGQPLICGSVLTFEHFTPSKKYGYDKVVMLAGGIGFGKKSDSLKGRPQKGEKIIVMGGDNYRIGMGGGAVSSVATGEYGNTIELNAVQRSNPEMQKRVANAIRGLIESDDNPITSIHDHGAGGHLNCISELVEEVGGKVELNKLPVGDPTLSAREIIGNESQERMGLVLKEKDAHLLEKIAERERAPFYRVGEVTGDRRFTFEDREKNSKPVDLELKDMFGNPPATVLEDETVRESFKPLAYDPARLGDYLTEVLQLEAVACKDWLTNKVDRSVTGRVAFQQGAGPLQLPLNNLGIAALDYRGVKGIATSLGHAPVAGLVDPAAGSVLSVAEALTNIIWAPLEGGLSGVSLSANWMWPARNKGENARLYAAVKAISDFAIGLGINIPTGKDSLSMTQKYSHDVVYSPGTVIVSAAAEVSDIRKTVGPVLKNVRGSGLIYIDFSGDRHKPGGSSFAQVLGTPGNEVPTVTGTDYFRKVFGIIQKLIHEEKILAGHDISAGGLITTLLEMCFASSSSGMDLDLTPAGEPDLIRLLFSENPGIVIQVKETDHISSVLKNEGIRFIVIGHPTTEGVLKLKHGSSTHTFNINKYRDIWYKTSYLLDCRQCGEEHALSRYRHYKEHGLRYAFPGSFTGDPHNYGIDPSRRKTTGIRAAIMREKGVNGDREMAYSLYYSGFDVKDVHMTDLITGRETLEGISFIVFVGGFSNSDVLGSAKGWAGAFLYNPKAREALDRFYARPDTLSLGVCNGCQLMVELGLITPGEKQRPAMMLNKSRKFESAFLNVNIHENDSVMLSSLAGSRLGIWVAHTEGRFSLNGLDTSTFRIPMRYSYREYPGNPNGSDLDAAAICSNDGRHLVMMPHIERAIFPWQWAYYPEERKKDRVSPWVEAFVNAREWIRGRKK